MAARFLVLSSVDAGNSTEMRVWQSSSDTQLSASLASCLTQVGPTLIRRYARLHIPAWLSDWISGERAACTLTCGCLPRSRQEVQVWLICARMALRLSNDAGGLLALRVLRTVLRYVYSSSQACVCSISRNAQLRELRASRPSILPSSD